MKARGPKQEMIDECRRKLLMIKQDVLNRIRTSSQQFVMTQDARGASGDEIDQTVAQLEEHTFLVSQERMRNHLVEIEMALARIENGTFGLCEETEEPIEMERLIAIPWTRFSIEGAEIREAMAHKYAR